MMYNKQKNSEILNFKNPGGRVFFRVKNGLSMELDNDLVGGKLVGVFYRCLKM